jgi:hypothetical protein
MIHFKLVMMLNFNARKAINASKPRNTAKKEMQYCNGIKVKVFASVNIFAMAAF